MKKEMLLVAVASLAMASCSQDEPVAVNNGNAIDFRAAMGTRGSETTTANLDAITVTALNGDNTAFFSNVAFTKNGTVFSSSPAYYWPSDGSTLNFYAYAPASTDLGGATITIDATGKTLSNFSPATDITEQKDFVTAVATGSKANESAGVALSFGHRLSQIEIKAKNGNSGYKYRVTGVRIANPVSKGTFDFSNNTWTLTKSEKAIYEATYAVSRVLKADATSLMASENDNAMLLPQQLVAWKTDDNTNTQKGAYLAVLVNICTASGAQVYPATAGEYAWAAVPIDTNWEAGKKYTYTLDFSNGAGRVDPATPNPDPEPNPQPGDKILGSPIEFTVNVSAWDSTPSNMQM